MNTSIETPVKKQRGRPAKKTPSNMEDLKQPIINELKMTERRGRGRPRQNRASSTTVDGPPMNRATTTKIDGTPKATEPKRALTTKETVDWRKQERELEKQEYKANMQKYLKERLRQGKAKIKLEASIKQLEARLNAL